ncbi:MAG: hypothetical protein HC922_09400 [Leptolyngbyaceae cyanobacterium SM2_3_12]|nr:hypothetical protein [Leptolyngbyaceae cyanobacterium SM2_3_12]
MPFTATVGCSARVVQWWPVILTRPTVNKSVGVSAAESCWCSRVWVWASFWAIASSTAALGG